jgi:hypothetical protein
MRGGRGQPPTGYSNGVAMAGLRVPRHSRRAAVVAASGVALAVTWLVAQQASAGQEPSIHLPASVVTLVADPPHPASTAPAPTPAPAATPAPPPAKHPPTPVHTTPAKPLIPPAGSANSGPPKPRGPMELQTELLPLEPAPGPKPPSAM